MKPGCCLPCGTASVSCCSSSADFQWHWSCSRSTSGAATVVGIAAAAFAGITVIADVIAYRRTTIAMGKAVPPILAVLGTLLESVVTPGPARKEG